MKLKQNLFAKAMTCGVVAVLSFTLTGCGSTGETSEPVPTVTVTETAEPEAQEPAAEPGAQEPEAQEPAAEPEAEKSDPAATSRQVVMKVTGAKSSALVKTLVVTNDGKEQGGQMNTQTLPFTQEVAVGVDQPFTKILVIAKYKDGQTGDINCSIEIDGQEQAVNSSSGHQPAECLIVEK